MSVMVPAEKAVATKRGVLAKLPKIYDPLGVVSPTMLSGKLVYRAVCDSKKAWDAPIADPLCRQWNKWESELPAKVEIPRSLAVHR